MNILRPEQFDSIVGQQQVVNVLDMATKSARSRDSALGHVLLSGPPGLGKTTFVRCIAAAMGVTFQSLNAATISSARSIMPQLMRAKEKSILFIDEIHRLPIQVQEFLYPVMEDFEIEAANMQIPEFTLIGATTRAGSLSIPFRDRFRLKLTLEYYPVEDLCKIIEASAGRLGITIDGAAALEIARCSRGTARIANNYLQWVRDCAVGQPVVTQKIARDSLNMQGIDEEGLTQQDRNYLTAMQQAFLGGPVGVASLSNTLNIAVDTITTDIEPYLLSKGYIALTSRGRKLLQVI
jgi:holliday junction DNA helicase RuvB